MSAHKHIFISNQGFGDIAEDDDDDEEDEEIEEDELVNLKQFGIHQALPIPDGEPDWDSGPPETAEEYIRRVRAEAAACPRVVRVEFDAEAHAAKQRARALAHAELQSRDGSPAPASPTAAGSQGATELRTAQRRQGTSMTGPPVASYVGRLLAAGKLNDGPDWAQPSPQWVRELVGSFRELRQWLVLASQQHAEALCQVRVPHMHDVKAWDRICFGILPTAAGARTIPTTLPSPAEPLTTPHPPPTSSTPPSHKQYGIQPATTGREDGSTLAEPTTAGATGTEDLLGAASCSYATTGTATRGGDGVEGLSIAPGGAPCEQDMVVGQAAASQGSRPAAVDDITLGPGVGGGSLEGIEGVSSDMPSLGMGRLSEPVLSTVLCLDQVGVGSLLQRCVWRLEEAEGLEEADAHWLFALAAVLQKPAHSDVVAALRCLTRRVLTLRGSLGGADDPQLPRLNTLAVVAGAYFGQDERLVRCVADLDMP